MKIFREMLKEEWRMHSSVFGSWRFGLFPVAMLAISTGIFAVLPRLGFSTAEVQFGMHFLVLFLGMNVGGIGFVSRSGMQNVLEDFNLLLFSSRTLPVSRSRILLAFILKDLVYYFFYFLVPLALGTLLLGLSLPMLLTTLLSYTLAFALGVAAVFLLSTVYTRVRKPLFAAGILALAGIYYLSGPGMEALNPAYLFYLQISLETFLLSLAPVLFLLVSGVHLFGYESHKREERHGKMYHRLRARFSPLNSKNLLDLQRSSGGYGKILVSFVILFAVFWFLVSEFPFGGMFLEAPMLSFAALLGMASASVYNWLNRFDSLDRYLHLPLDEGDLLRSKLRSFALVGLPLIVAGDLAAFLVLQPPFTHLIHAVLISVTTSLYLLAVLVRLTGLDPSTMMFDFTVLLRFVVYGSVVLVPVLVLSMMYTSYPFNASVALALSYLLLIPLSVHLMVQEVGGLTVQEG